MAVVSNFNYTKGVLFKKKKIQNSVVVSNFAVYKGYSESSSRIRYFIGQNRQVHREKYMFSAI